jgi:tetratricopeptide (TPR) repeat protein
MLIGSAFAVTLEAAEESYVYEEQDAEAERELYLTKIEQDKDKCDLAIQNTKMLISRSKNRPYQPTLLLRLAELYIEKSRLVYYLRRSAGQQNAGGLDEFETNMLKQEAIEIYQQILSHHPDFEACDKVHFFLAHEYRELGELENMLAEYREIINNFKGSNYVPESHLLMGDYYFNQKQDLDGAITEYKAVLDYPESSSAAVARYKLAWCRINEEDYKGAIALFEEAVRGGSAQETDDIDTYQRVDVRLESLVDMAFCYPEVHKKVTAEEAIDYFKGYAWSRPVYAQVLEKLALRFYVKKRWAQAAGVYRELSALREDAEDLLEYAHRIFECVDAMENYDTAAEDVTLLVKALEKQKYSVHVDADEKEQNLTSFELFARETITHLHAKARNTVSKEDFAVVADAYKTYLDFFDEGEAVEDMHANYAEALFSAERFLEAGKEYEEYAPAATVNRKQRVENLYSAVISYYNALKEKEEMNFYQSTYARAGLRSAGKLFTTENPDSSRTPDVAFNVAWVAYDAGDYRDAIDEFTEFIDTYPTHTAATAAIQLSLDAYYLLEDEEGLLQYGKNLLAGGRVTDTALKAEVTQIVRGTESKMVSDMTMTAMNDWESGKEELARISESGSETSEQALNALILTAREKKDLATLYDAGTRMVASYPDSDNVENTLGILIDTSMKIGQFRLLGEYMEGFATRYTKNENAADFALQAARIQEALGEYSDANANYRRRLTLGSLKGDALDEVVFAMAENTEQLGNPSGAAKVLDAYLTRLTDDGKVRAYAMMGTFYRASGQRSLAQKYGKMAQSAFEKKPRYDDADLRKAMGQLVFEETESSAATFFALQFAGDIDNKIFAQKTELLTQLEDGYQQVMGYKSSGWTLRACFRAAELNREFATFLTQSPLPSGLTAEQQQEYRTLLSQKAAPYQEKAEEYLRTCETLAEKSELCDPKLAGYYLPSGAPQGNETSYRSLETARSCKEIGRGALSESTIAGIYQALYEDPEDATLLFQLAQAYLDGGDYRQAILIAQNALSKKAGNKGALKAQLLNLIGVCRLSAGEDSLARDAFKQALKADDDLAAARVNLAGLYNHYGHADKASELLGEMGAGSTSISGTDAVDPKAESFFNEYAMRTP